jgi:hypothetical protein
MRSCSVRISRPFRARSFLVLYPGRCPGLLYPALSGLFGQALVRAHPKRVLRSGRFQYPTTNKEYPTEHRKPNAYIARQCRKLRDVPMSVLPWILDIPCWTLDILSTFPSFCIARPFRTTSSYTPFSDTRLWLGLDIHVHKRMGLLYGAHK